MSRRRSSAFEPFIDVFASLVFVLIFALVVSLLRSAQSAEQLEAVEESTRYQVHLRKELARDLSARLGNLVDVDEKTGNITLGENQVTFREGSAALGKRGRRLLRRIVEPLAEVAFSDKYRDDLERIVVEGHTNSNRRPDDPFFNWRLSAARALTVVRFLLHVSGKHREQYNHYLEAVGKAEREPIMVDGREDLARSRRIVIKVVLDDRRLVDQLARDLEKVIQEFKAKRARQPVTH